MDSPANLTDADLERLFEQLELLERAETGSGQEFVLRRMLQPPLVSLTERWLVWTYDPTFRYPLALPPLSAFERRDEGIGLVMAWRVLERVLDDMRTGALDLPAVQKKLLYLLEHAPSRIRAWLWRLLHHQLVEGIDRAAVDRLVPGLLARES